MTIDGKKIYLISGILTLLIFYPIYGEKITLSGKVTDFKGKPVEGAMVEVKYKDFKTAYETYSRKDGTYSMDIEKGTYMAMGSMRMDEYPKQSRLPQKDQKLEFWLWNLIAEKDLKIDIRYHKLEVYGVNIFRIQGATPGYTIYCRPMSLSRYFSLPVDKRQNGDLCPGEKEVDIKVEVNGKPIRVNMKQKVKEYVKRGTCHGYLLHIPLPEDSGKRDYDIFRIVIKDLKNGDKGESVFMKPRSQYR